MKFCGGQSNRSELVLWPQLTRVTRSPDEHARDAGSTAPEHGQGAHPMGRVVPRLEGDPLPGRSTDDYSGARSAAAPGRLRIADDTDGLLPEACDAAAG